MTQLKEYSAEDFKNHESWGDLLYKKVEWKGFYNMTGQKNEMIIKHLMITDQGGLTGFGQDQVGSFSIEGEVKKDGSVEFKKEYHGQHSIEYKGELKEGTIKGKWNLNGMEDEFEIKINEIEKWTGHYEQFGTKNDMTLNLHIDYSGVFGAGNDANGGFVLRGKVQGNQVSFIKQYLGAHTALYHGIIACEGDNMFIRGYWDINGAHDKFELSCFKPQLKGCVLETPPYKTVEYSKVVWTGFFEQKKKKFDMSFDLQFSGRKVTGEGKDDLGPFKITGEKIGTVVTLKKTYQVKRGSTVIYSGSCTEQGDTMKIAGRWRLHFQTGPFEITGKPVITKIDVPKTRVEITEWSGYYEQFGNKNDMKLNFTADHTAIRGNGTDDVGEFNILGFVNPDSTCQFEKSYVGKHSLTYEGTLGYDIEGNQIIKGKWSLTGMTGDFELVGKKKIDWV